MKALNRNEGEKNYKNFQSKVKYELKNKIKIKFGSSFGIKVSREVEGYVRVIQNYTKQMYNSFRAQERGENKLKYELLNY